MDKEQICIQYMYGHTTYLGYHNLIGIEQNNSKKASQENNHENGGETLSQAQKRVTIIISQLLQQWRVSSYTILECMGQSGDAFLSLCWNAEMPSNPMEVWKNQQEQTTMMLNNQKIRRTWPTQEQTMSQMCSALQAKYSTIILCLSAFHPSPRSQSQLHSSKKSFAYPVFIFLLHKGLISQYRLSYNPGIALTKTWI